MLIQLHQTIPIIVFGVSGRKHDTVILCLHPTDKQRPSLTDFHDVFRQFQLLATTPISNETYGV